jgi:O-antigen ligase
MQETSMAPFGLNTDVLRQFAPRAMPFAYASAGALLLMFFQTGGHNDQRAIEVVFLFAVAVLLAVSRRARELAPALSRQMGGLLAAFFVLGSASAAVALVPRFAFYEVCSLFLLLVLGLAIAAEIARGGSASLLRLLQAIGVVCLLYAFKVFVVYLSAFAIGAAPDPFDFAPGFNNYRFLNHAQTATLPLLVLVYLLSAPASRVRWLWFSLTAFWWAIICVTAARGTFLGMLAACAGALAMGRRQALPFVKAMFATALAGALAYLVMFELLPRLAGLDAFGVLSGIVERTAADPASGRQRLWTRSVELIAAHPLLGAGPLHFAHYAAQVRTGAHPHNWAFQILVEWGIPAFLCLAAAIALGTRRLVRLTAALEPGDWRNRQIGVALLASGLAILADGLVSGLLVMPQSQLLIAIYLGCAIGWSNSLTRRNPGTTGKACIPSSLAALLLLAGAAGLAAGVWPEIGEHLRHTPRTTNALNYGPTWPRLWLDGYF